MQRKLLCALPGTHKLIIRYFEIFMTDGQTATSADAARGQLSSKLRHEIEVRPELIIRTISPIILFRIFLTTKPIIFTSMPYYSQLFLAIHQVLQITSRD